MAEDLLEFRKLKNVNIDNIDIPARAENRRVTDIAGYVLIVIFAGISLAFIIMVLLKSDLNRLKYEYDDCGNLCGQKNSKVAGIPCSGVDYTGREWMYKERVLGYSRKRTCVKTCPQGTKAVKNTMSCINETLINESDKVEILDTMRLSAKVWWKYLIVVIIVTFLAAGLVLGLRYWTKGVVWGSLILSLLCAIAWAAYGWMYFASHSDNSYQVAFMASAATLYAVAMIVFMICGRRGIELTIELCKEATEAVFAMPLLMFVAFMTIVVQCVIVGIFIFLNIAIFTSWELKEVSTGVYSYELYKYVYLAALFNLFMLVWTLFFWNGLIYMTVAGTIALWFFTRNKRDLHSPICTSLCITVKYHLGTVAVGAFIMLIVTILQWIVEAATRQQDNFCGMIIRCCCECIRDLIEYLKDRAYIETAIHGQAFCKSGRRAIKLLIEYLGDALSVSVVVSIVFMIMGLLVTLICILFSVLLFMNMDNYWLPCIICFVISALITYVTFRPIRIAIDTLFICFCEDQVVNNGGSRPYCMSKNLMLFIEEARDLYKKDDEPTERR